MEKGYTVGRFVSMDNEQEIIKDIIKSLLDSGRIREAGRKYNCFVCGEEYSKGSIQFYYVAGASAGYFQERIKICEYCLIHILPRAVMKLSFPDISNPLEGIMGGDEHE